MAPKKSKAKAKPEEKDSKEPGYHWNDHTYRLCEVDLGTHPPDLHELRMIKMFASFFLHQSWNGIVWLATCFASDPLEELTSEPFRRWGG